MSLLEVSDLRVFYSNIEAIRGLSLRIEPGEMVAVLGSNGAGKTTTLRAISGLERPRSGSIVFDVVIGVSKRAERAEPVPRSDTRGGDVERGAVVANELRDVHARDRVSRDGP